MSDFDNEKFLVRVSKKTGKIDICLSGYSTALLKLWALQNTTKTKDTYIFLESGEILVKIVGTQNLPQVEYHYDSNSPHRFNREIVKIFVEAMRKED